MAGIRDMKKEIPDHAESGCGNEKKEYAGILEDAESGAAVLDQSQFQYSGYQGYVFSAAQSFHRDHFGHLIESNEGCNDQEGGYGVVKGRCTVFLCVIHSITRYIISAMALMLPWHRFSEKVMRIRQGWALRCSAQTGSNRDI